MSKETTGSNVANWTKHEPENQKTTTGRWFDLDERLEKLYKGSEESLSWYSEFCNSEEVKKMLLSDLIFTILFIAQTVVGLLGNSILLMLYVTIFISHHRQKITDLILTHLTVANTVTLLTQTTPGMVIAFRWENSLDIIGCQVNSYIRRVARGLCICTTCVLSSFQAVTISPSNSGWAHLKHHVPKLILPAFIIFWIFNLLVEVNALKPIVNSKNVTIPISGDNRKSCTSIYYLNKINNSSFLSAKTVRDIFSVLLMSLASGYMVLMLRRHRRQIQHIHSSRQTHKASPESRATQTILLLVTCFVSFYCINSSITLFLNFIKMDDMTLYDPLSFLGSCYAFLCPWVLISSDPRISRLKSFF
ncbi:vomeronasal type-1 receptor 3-like [Tachyglossus aculeatus]|uniref:vomeronasal type-1 receptor 3-like n=1 Tax=Tachyglossus aculeatus TaxID=9261 RepID=UPI0018F65AF6|nr:vomeronasal type-1 receptor 3-like [Tachyglossus aculeatus]